MAFIRTIPPHEATGAVRDMYARQEDHWGYVPNYAKVFSHRPEVLARWGRLLAELRRPADDRRFELVTFAAALALRHSACTLAHGQKLAALIGNDAVLAIAAGREADVLDAAEVAMLRFAREVALDASQIDAEAVETLTREHGLSDDEIFDIAAIAAGRSFFTKLLDALGVVPDAAFMAIDDELRRTLTVGRPIGDDEAEYTSADHASGAGNGGLEQ